MNEGKPLSRAELQKLDDGVYISEVRKLQAGAVSRKRETADKSWKIAATVAAVVLVAGFTETINQAPSWIRVLGAIAIVLWAIATALFLWVNQEPSPDSSAWQRAIDGAESSMKDEITRAQDDAVKERETYVRKIVRASLSVISKRVKFATWAAIIALTVTAFVLVALAFVDDRDLQQGTMLLSSEAVPLIAASCPRLDEAAIRETVVTIDVRSIGTDGLSKIDFEPGICDDEQAVLHLEASLLRGLLVRQNPLVAR